MDIATTHGPYGNPPPALATLPPEIVAQNRELIHAVKALNAAGQFGQDNELTYLFDRETHRPVFRVVNRKTRKVTGQIAPERVLEIARDSAG
jgi:uncharacterized FlaG/YvyC family protein